MHFSKFLLAAMVTVISPVIAAPSNQLQRRDTDYIAQAKQEVKDLSDLVTGDSHEIVTTVATVNRAVFARVNAQVGVDVQLIVSALAGSATKIAVGLKDHTTPITQPQVDRFNEILDIAKTTLGGVVSDLQSCAAKITSAATDLDAASRAQGEATINAALAQIKAAAAPWAAALTTFAKAATCTDCATSAISQLQGGVDGIANVLSQYKPAPVKPPQVN